ncbi:MAG: adenylate/guanylate cyclase domain-containing protein [Pseudomonadota bacterium]|uniref:adenylate/guanylate cyclase domain-containing protein n=1 Tax=Polaromonas sp. TaxID=1869339 RepID=UPI0017E532A5|nr:adenylate/guanylate cyclase domain-containing protein [Polaromonas sp.]MBA3593315.1 adenylate/guanylate cyclase domain-containing protein [Polaromonas sp.]MDQ3271904.1 adenylate/guanylate cyclase domain-containing protein [Pseudomonadota bacterium]
MTTVVFADLVGSTSMFERLGDETASRFVTQLVGALSQVFEQHSGRVVKLLGDGLFVVFPQEGDALAACISIQKRFLEKPIRPGGSGAPVQMQMGIESGEVAEIDGDCFGDTVNSAARLADLAGAAQILTTQNVWLALGPLQQASLRSLGPMHLRGRAEASHVYRVEWQAGRDEDATMMGRSLADSASSQVLSLVAGEQTLQIDARSLGLSIGRGAGATLTLNDPRVSRMHATLEWRGGQFVLSDASSYGTWVYFGNQSDAVVLRRTECYLVGSGQISAGCERREGSPLINFSISS